MRFKAPPINEVGMNAGTIDTLLSAYEIGRFHERVRSSYPNTEHVLAAPGPDIAQMNGIAPLNENPLVSRWWLISPDDTNVLQLQENFFGLNWRRRAGLDAAADYPGFDKLIGDFFLNIDVLRDWRHERGYAMPEPHVCELHYDDIIVAPANFDPQIAKVLTFAPPPSAGPIFGWQCNWMEPVPLVSHPHHILKVHVVAAGVEVSGTVRPVIRIIWTAMAMEQTWEAVGGFFRLAHDHIRTRFIELVQSDIRQSWRPE